MKYGQTPEIHAEVAATHLLTALGFGADDVSMVRRVRCHGCPRWPFRSRQIAERLHLDSFLRDRIDYDEYHDFEWVSVERRDRKKDLEFGNEEGWAFHELSSDRRLDGRRDRRRGGRAQTDGDVPPSLGQQGAEPASGLHLSAIGTGIAKGCRQTFPRCDRPLAMMQDVGSTFGPRKVDLRGSGGNGRSGPTRQPARSA